MNDNMDKKIAPVIEQDAKDTMNKQIAQVIDQDENSHIKENHDSDDQDSPEDSHMEGNHDPDNDNSPSFMDANKKMELLQITGSQGKYECTCGHPHATIVDRMTNNDTRNVLLLLDTKRWMATLIEKINALLVSLEDNTELSTIIDKFQKDKCIITKAKSFFNILDGFKKLLNSSSFQMDKTKYV